MLSHSPVAEHPADIPAAGTTSATSRSTRTRANDAGPHLPSRTAIMHCIGRIAPVNVAPIAAPGAKRTARRTAAARQLCRAGSSDEDGKDDDRERRPAQMPRRKLINLAAATTALLVSDKANANEFAGDAAMAIMNRVGKVRMSDDECNKRKTTVYNSRKQLD